MTKDPHRDWAIDQAACDAALTPAKLACKLSGWILTCLFSLLFYIPDAFALVTITPANATISADTTSVAPGTGVWTTLAGPVLQEAANKDIANPGSIILNVPTGFAFNPLNPVTVAVSCTTGGGSNVTLVSPTATVTSTQVRIDVASVGGGSRVCRLTWSGIQVRPNLAGTILSVGNITLSGTSVVQGAPAGTSFGTLTEVPGAPASLAYSGQPANAIAGASLGTVSVLIQDRFGNTVTSATDTVSLAIANNPGGGTLSGTTSAAAVSGVATFSTLSINKSGIGYTLAASSPALTGATSNSFNISDTGVVSSFMVEASGGGAIGNQIQNSAFGIRVSARDIYNNIVVSFTGTVSISSTGTLSAGSGATAAFTAGMRDPHSVTISNSGNFTITATSGAISGTSNAFTVSPTVGGFNSFESSVLPATAISGSIWTKVSGSAFSLDIVALNLAKTTQTPFTGTVTVSLLGNMALGTLLDANGCPVSSTTLQTSNVVMTSSSRQTVAFAAVSDVWRDVRVRISYAGPPVVTSCSGDNFAIRPASLTINGVTDATATTAGVTRSLNNLTFAAGNPVHHAGRPFTIRATATNAVGAITTNYVGAPAAVVSTCIGAGPPAACLSPIQADMALGTWTSDTGVVDGVVRTSTASYGQVGSFGLQLEDQTFASVDAADGTTNAARFVPLSAKVDIGRFVPDSYVLSSPSMTNRTDIPGCHVQTTGTIAAASASLSVTSVANLAIGDTLLIRGAGVAGIDLIATVTAISGSTMTLSTAATVAVTNAVVYKVAFTYHGETMGMGYTITARNSLSSTALSSYNGSWARGSVAIQAENNNDGVDRGSRVLGAGGSWASGVYAVSASGATFSRNLPPDGPFNNLQIGVTVADPDGPVLGGRSMNPATATDCLALANCTGVPVGTIGMRFGRLKLSNVYGSELLNLPIPIETEYWNGASFVTNTQDSCTLIAASNVQFVPGGYRGGINSGNMNSANVTIGGAFVSGKGRLALTKPTGPPTSNGSADIAIDLGVGAENKTYLLTGPTSSANPTARATFGVYKRGPITYMREMY